MLELLVGGVIALFMVMAFWFLDRSTAPFDKRQEVPQDCGHSRESDMAAVLRDSPMGPYDFRVDDVDWVVALGLNTTRWHLIDPNDGRTVVTDDIGIAIDNLDWGCKVTPVERKDV